MRPHPTRPDVESLKRLLWRIKEFLCSWERACLLQCYVHAEDSKDLGNVLTGNQLSYGKGETYSPARVYTAVFPSGVSRWE